MKAALVAIGVFMALLGVLVIAGSALPTRWEVGQQVEIPAAAARIHAWVGNLERWPEWKAWRFSADPEMQTWITGRPDGAGATLHWKSEAAGSGRLHVRHNSPQAGVCFRVRLAGSPEPARHAITYRPVGSQRTKVEWYASGDVGYAPLGGYMAFLIRRVMSEHVRAALHELQRQLASGAWQERKTQCSSSNKPNNASWKPSSRSVSKSPP